MSDGVEKLKQNAARLVSSYPQFVTQFDDYVLVRVRRQIKNHRDMVSGRGKLIFSKDEVTIAEPQPRKSAIGLQRAVFSVKARRVVYIGASLVEDLQDETA